MILIAIDVFYLRFKDLSEFHLNHRIDLTLILGAHHHHNVSKFRKTSKKRRVEDEEDEDGDIVMKDSKDEVEKK